MGYFSFVARIRSNAARDSLYAVRPKGYSCHVLIKKTFTDGSLPESWMGRLKYSVYPKTIYLHLIKLFLKQ
jgi:hypothetical protein